MCELIGKLNLTGASLILYIILIISLFILVITVKKILEIITCKDEEKIVFDALVYLNDEDTKKNVISRSMARKYANKSLKLSKINNRVNTFIIFISFLFGSFFLFSNFNSIASNPLIILKTLVIPIGAQVWVFITSFNRIRVEYLKILLTYDMKEISRVELTLMGRCVNKIRKNDLQDPAFSRLNWIDKKCSKKVVEVVYSLESCKW